MFNPLQFYEFGKSRNTPIAITNAITNAIWTWYGRPNWASSAFANKYWIGYVDDLGRIKISEFNIETEIYSNSSILRTTTKDDHNNCKILLRSDNKIVAFYNQHNATGYRRISVNDFDISSFGNELSIATTCAYLSPYEASNGNIFIFYRKVVSDEYPWYYNKSTDGGVSFGTEIEYYQNTGFQNYNITYQDGDIIHFIATNGHPQTNISSNINQYHFYFDMITETFHESDGTSISLPITPASATLITATTGNDSSWNLDIITKNGNPRVLYTLYPSGRTTDFLTKHLYFKEWNGSAWVNETFIAETMVGYVEDDTSTEDAYSECSRFDQLNPDIIWMPKRISGVMEIHKVTMPSVNIKQLTFNSAVDQWRPISVNSPKNNLIWIDKLMYDYFTDFNTNVVSGTVNTNIYNSPDAVDDLAFVDIYSNALDLSWTTPLSDEPISHYEIYLNNILIGKTQNTTYFIQDDVLESEFYEVKIKVVNIYFNKSGFSNIISTTTPADDYYWIPEYQAILDEATTLMYTLPSTEQSVVNNQKIKNLIAENIWDELSVLWVAKQESGLADFATLNWKSPSTSQLYNANPSLKPDYIANSGFKAGSGKFFRTNYFANSDANIDKTNISIFYKTFDIPTTYTANSWIFGARNGNNDGQILIADNSNINFLYRTFTSQSNNTTQANENKHTFVNKETSIAKVYKEGVFSLDVITSGTVGAITSQENIFLGYNENGTVTPSVFACGLSYLAVGNGTGLSGKQVEIYEIMEELY